MTDQEQIIVLILAGVSIIVLTCFGGWYMAYKGFGWIDRLFVAIAKRLRR